MLMQLHEADLIHVQAGCHAETCLSKPWWEILKCYLKSLKTDNVWAG